MMTRFFASVGLASAMLAAPALALPVKPGVSIVDPQGGAVGTVFAIDADANVVVDTGTHKLALPLTSFRPSDDHLVVALTRAELDAQATAKEAIAASLTVGKPVKGTEGSVLGTIDSINGDMATLLLTSGQKINFPMSAITGSADGAVAGISAAQIEAQLDAVRASTAAPAAGTPSS